MAHSCPLAPGHRCLGRVPGRVRRSAGYLDVRQRVTEQKAIAATVDQHALAFVSVDRGEDAGQTVARARFVPRAGRHSISGTVPDCASETSLIPVTPSIGGLPTSLIPSWSADLACFRNSDTCVGASLGDSFSLRGAWLTHPAANSVANPTDKVRFIGRMVAQTSARAN